MNNFTKISAVALLAIFLTACDKPANKEASSTQAQPTATQPAMSPEAEQAQGVEDFKKLLDWNAQQEKTFQLFQQELQQKLQNGNKNEFESTLTEFSAKVDGVLKSLDALEIKNPQVNEFRVKTKETLKLSNEVIAQSVKAMVNQGDTEAQKMVQEKAQKLIEAGKELEALQAQLQQKFGAK